MTTFGELIKPTHGRAVRFCTSLCISGCLKTHGINGFFEHNRFWSEDRADHWAPHEIVAWEFRHLKPATTT